MTRLLTVCALVALGWMLASLALAQACRAGESS